MPLVAFGVFINQELKMPLDEQSRFYATIFLPWSFKPIFAYIMDTFKLCGTHRKAYIVIANICLGLSIIGTSLLVETTFEMYCFSLVRSGLEALSESGLGLILIDVVGASRMIDSNDANVAQSQATAARMTGSLVSFIFGLFIYGCGRNETSSSRTIIGLSSILCIFSASSALFLPNTHTPKSEVAEGIREPTLQSHEQIKEEPLTWCQRVKVALGIACFQFCFVWIGVQSLVPLVPWIVILILCSGGILSFFCYQVVKSNLPWTPVACAVLLFMLNASPSYESPWFSFQLHSLRDSMCSMQILLMVGEMASLLGCWSFPRLTNWYLSSRNDLDKKKRAEHALVFFMLLASLAGVLHIVLALDWKEFSSMDDTMVLLQFGTIAFISSYFAQLSFIAKQVFATEHSYDNAQIGSLVSPGVLYGIFLSLVDFGDSASAWISSPLTKALNLSYADMNYDLLWAMVPSCSCTMP